MRVPSTADRLRVLILADVCNPEHPSLPIVGYNYARALAEQVDATVVTQVRNQADIDRVGLGQAKIAYLDTEWIASPLYKLAVALRGGTSKGWTIQMMMDYPSYLAFEWAAWQQFGPALKAGEFDLVQRITPMSPTLASWMAHRCPVPFVVGPLNGNLPWSPLFTAELKREREWLSKLRSAYKVLPYRRSTYADTAAILAAFDHTIADLPDAARAKTINFPEVGIDPERFALPQRSASDRMTILYAGRLVPYKLPEVVVQAMTSRILRQHRLIVVGDGPERPRLEQIIAEHNLSDCVQLVGQKSQAEVGQLMQQADIFAFPSIRELGAGVVVEAMACGLANVVVDYGAPATLIDSAWGVKVPMGRTDQLVERYTAALEDLVRHPDRTRQLGLAAHKHAIRYYTWERKARKTVEIYNWVLGRQSEKPNFWQPEHDRSPMLTM